MVLSTTRLLLLSTIYCLYIFSDYCLGYGSTYCTSGGGGGGGNYGIPDSCQSYGYDCVAYAKCVWRAWFPGQSEPYGNGGKLLSNWSSSTSLKLIDVFR